MDSHGGITGSLRSDVSSRSECLRVEVGAVPFVIAGEAVEVRRCVGGAVSRLVDPFGYDVPTLVMVVAFDGLIRSDASRRVV